MSYVKTALTLLFSVFFLVACGGGGGGGGGGGSPVAEFAGVWDFSADEASGRDIGYMVIRADGTATEYDFQGDSVDNGLQCYQRENFRITSTGSGQFTVQRDDGGTLSLGLSLSSSDTLLVTGDDTGDYPRSTLAESEFVLCSTSEQTGGQLSCTGNRIWRPFTVNDDLNGYFAEADGRSAEGCIVFWEYSPNRNCSTFNVFESSSDVSASVQNDGSLIVGGPRVDIGDDPLPVAGISVAFLNSLPDC